MERFTGSTPAEQAQAFLDTSPRKLGENARGHKIYCR